MAFKIGFTAEEPVKNSENVTSTSPKEQVSPRKSVVQVNFSSRNMTLAYYNDQFDLRRGDLVYVDGKLEGMLGCVTDVNYNFKIKISDYKRVIAVADTDVSGQFFMAGSHFVTFDPKALPRDKAVKWFKSPSNADDEIVSGNDNTSFNLYNLGEMNVGTDIAERGHDCYMENKIKYICLDGANGYAVVEGRKHYEIEFTYCDGEISGLVCSCFFGGSCKHEFAAMLQLRETLELIEKHYADEYKRTGYFAAITKGALFTFAVDRKETGSFTL